MRLTGIDGLDRLVSPLRRGWIVEFYGGEATLRLVYHRAIAEASRRGRVAVVHVQEFGGLNPYLLSRLARIAGGSVDNIVVSRAFRLGDVAGLIRRAVETGAETIVVVDPYLYAPRSWRGYARLSPITAALREAAARATVVVANRATRYGSHWLPEGGGFHHHSVHVMVRLQPARRGVLAVLVKHPWKKAPRMTLVPSSEVVGLSWVGRRPLLEYL